MTYREWYKKFVDGDKNQQTEIKKRTKKHADRLQYDRYKTVLRDNVPKSFEKFQDLKYNDNNRYEQLKREYKTIREIKNKNWSDSFKEKAIKAYYEFKAEEIEVTSHFISRYLERNSKDNFEKISFADVITLLKKGPNYIDKGREVYFSPEIQLACIKGDSNVEILTFVRRKKEKEKWVKI